MNGWIDITIDDQDSTQVMLVPGGMLVVHTVRSFTTKPASGKYDDAHYRPAMVFVPGDKYEMRAWLDATVAIARAEKAGAR